MSSELIDLQKQLIKSLEEQIFGLNNYNTALKRQNQDKDQIIENLKREVKEQGSVIAQRIEQFQNNFYENESKFHALERGPVLKIFRDNPTTKFTNREFTDLFRNLYPDIDYTEITRRVRQLYLDHFLGRDIRVWVDGNGKKHRKIQYWLILKPTENEPSEEEIAEVEQEEAAEDTEEAEKTTEVIQTCLLMTPN